MISCQQTCKYYVLKSNLDYACTDASNFKHVGVKIFLLNLWSEPQNLAKSSKPIWRHKVEWIFTRWNGRLSFSYFCSFVILLLALDRERRYLRFSEIIWFLKFLSLFLLLIEARNKSIKFYAEFWDKEDIAFASYSTSLLNFASLLSQITGVFSNILNHSARSKS